MPLVTKLFNGLASLLFGLAILTGLWAAYLFKLDIDGADWNRQECLRLLVEKANPSKAKYKSGEYGSEEYYARSNIIHPCKIDDYQMYFQSKMTAKLAGLLIAAGLLVLMFKKLLVAFKKVMTWLFS